MLINILTWLFGPTKKPRGRSSGGDGDELVGWLVVVVVVMIFSA